MIEFGTVLRCADMPRMSVHPNYIQEVNLAWKRKREEFDRDLAQQLGPSLPIVIVNLFLKGEPVNRVNFIEICQLLELDWREVAGLEVSEDIERAIAKPLESITEVDKAINQLVGTLCEMLRRITRKAGDLVNADRTSIFLLDRQTKVLGTIIADDGAGGCLLIDIPANRGIASLAATSLQIINVPFDVYDDPRSEQAQNTDKKTGYRTYTLLAWPLLNQQQNLIAVVQLINKLQPNNNPADELSKRIDTNGFSKEDEAKLAKFAPSILKILEKCQFCYQLSLKVRKSARQNKGGSAAQNARLIAQLKRREQQLRRSLNKI